MSCRLTEYDLTSAKSWGAVLDRAPWVGKDIYFYPHWYASWVECGYGEARCLHAEIDGAEFLYPFLFKRIDGYDLPREYFDVETAYGYGGVLWHGEGSSVTRHRFNQMVDEWMIEHNAVAEMVRLAPSLNQSQVRDCEYFKVRSDVYLDMDGLSEAFLWSQVLSGGARTDIRKSRKAGLTVSVSAVSERVLNEFFEVYRETFLRIQMEPFYAFSPEYFKAFRKWLHENALAATVYYNNKVAASSLWIFQGKVLHYYLGATGDEFTRVSCSDAYFWAIILYSLEVKQFDCLHFGGGLSTKPDDSLFRFKSKYGSRAEDVFMGRKVLLPKVYDALAEQWAARYPELVNKHGYKILKYRIMN